MAAENNDIDWGNNAFDDAIDDVANSNLNPDEESIEHQRIVRYGNDTEQRKILVYWVIWLTSIYLGVILIVLMFVGGGLFTFNDGVLVTLLATTTATVLGLPLVVLKGLFKDRDE